MIATLPMYDRPESQATNDRFYTLFRRAFPEAPEMLGRGDPGWTDRNLLLSQTCSLPYRAALHNDVRIVATPIHPFDCPEGLYFSVIVVRQDDPRETFEDYINAPLAINSRLSQSGWAAIDQIAQEKHLSFSDVIEFGSHQASAKAVADGKADIASIDVVSWSMIERWDAFASKLRILQTTDPTPALPYITSQFNDFEMVQNALIDAVHDLPDADKDILCLNGLAEVPMVDYLSMPIPPAPLHLRVHQE